MRNVPKLLIILSVSTLLTSCATNRSQDGSYAMSSDYSSRLPQSIEPGERTIVVDPRMHAWGAYDANGQLIRSGLASSGRDWCNDTNRPCRTHTGSYRIQSMGGPDCASKIFPVGVGGSPMPYCMFFYDGQALHGVPPSEIGEGNYSHGCVRLQVADAEWLRYDFANVGTRVVIKSY